MIITCPQCASLGTVDRGVMAWVTCARASCGHQFLAWPPGTKHDAEAEFIERRFFCAVHDLPFFVVFGRRTKEEQFQVMEVHGQKGWLGAAILAYEHKRLGRSQPGTAVLVPGSGTALSIAAPALSFRQLLARAFAPMPATNDKASVRWQRPTAEQVLATMQARIGDADDLDFGAVDLDGWHCFHCDHEGVRGSNFVHCTPRCQELVCQGRSEMRTGGLYFRCRASCGCASATVEKPIAVGGERFALPQTAGKHGLIGNGSPRLITQNR